MHSKTEAHMEKSGTDTGNRAGEFAGGDMASEGKDNRTDSRIT